jgi:hypothetical protein
MKPENIGINSDEYQHNTIKMCSFNEKDRPSISEVYRYIENKTYSKFAQNKSVNEIIIANTETITAKVTDLKQI